MRRTVLVTDAARGSAVAVIRSLGAAGWRVVAADPSRLAPGRYSRHTAVRATYPDPLLDPRGAAEAVLGLAAEHDVDLVIPVTDDIGTPLDALADVVPPGTRLASPPPAVRRFATDKAATFALAEQLGVPRPDTVVVAPGEDVDPAAVGAQLGWPVVVKPAESRRLTETGLSKHEVTIARDVASLQTLLADRSAGTLLLQAMVAGEGHGVELLCDGGRPVAAFQHRRVREVPLGGGPSSSRESVELDPGLYTHSAELLAAADWTGLAMVEWKVGPGGPALMEINGRIWGSLPLALAAGVDFPSLLADLLCGDGLAQRRTSTVIGVGAETPYEVGVRTRSLELELRWIMAVLRSATADGDGPTRRDALRVAAGLFDPREGYDVQSRRDPVPGVVDLLRLVRKLRRSA